KKKGMATAPPRLLRGLIAPLSLSPADWLPCHQQLLTSASLLHRWLARLRCSDGFKLFLVVLLVSAALAEVRFVASASMAPTLRPGDRAVAEKVAVSYMHVRAAVCGGYCLLQGAYRAAELWHK
uniref:Peptidase S26 domain-containing protein n=1 Tax=Aegilops tauschii subsp. strangulata TaxID=200361 RepID=A0A453DMF9_AEGTS